MKTMSRVGNKQFYAKLASGSISCGHCGRIIDSKHYYYCEDDKKKLCNKCYCQIINSSIQQLQTEAEELESGTEIYVGGKKYFCHDERHQIRTYAKILRSDRPETMILQITVCNECGRIAIMHKQYEKHKFSLRNYKMISCRTGQPYSECRLSENYDPRYVVCNDTKIPDTVLWAAQHPFQGGRCSGK